MPKVSILIPIYNTEEYLEQCVRSAIGQTLDDIEIVCLNDGSTDGSGKILRSLAKEDARIVIVDKENSGYGHTMNMGIRMAKGKYILFLESDDYILPRMAERMYELCEEHSLEILKSDYYAFLMNGGKIFKRYRSVSRLNDYHQVLDATEKAEAFLSERYTWLCMYQREYLLKNKIFHNESPGASYQDNGFWFQSMMHCRRLYYVDEAFYMYRMDNPNASIHNKSNVRAVANEYKFIRNKILDYKANQRNLFTIAGIIDFKLHLWSALRLAPEYMQELSHVLGEEMKVYFESGCFDFRMVHPGDAKQFLVALAAPREMCKYAMSDSAMRNEKINMLTKYDILILYGAGNTANQVMWWIDELRVWDREIHVSETEAKKGTYFQDVEVERISDLQKYKDDAAVVLCTRRSSRYFGEMKENLLSMKFKNIIYADDILKNDSWVSDTIIG